MAEKNAPLNTWQDVLDAGATVTATEGTLMYAMLKVTRTTPE